MKCVKIGDYSPNPDVRICTCNKPFMTSPTTFKIHNEYKDIDFQSVPKEYLICLKGDLFHILGCRGCLYTDEIISVQNDFEKALRASIVSCVFQRVKENDDRNYADFEYFDILVILLILYLKTMLSLKVLK